MDETFSLDILFANADAPDELYTLVRNGSCSQLKTRLDELPNSIEYLTSLTSHGQGQLTLLMVAALNGYDEIVRLLLTHCDPIHQVELKGIIVISDEYRIDGATALYCACYQGHFNVAKTLIELGQVNINQDTYEYPCYPLFIHATIMNRLDIVRFLVENGYSDVNETKSTDQNECTALIWAAFRNYTPVVEYLIENGADVNYSCGGTSLDARTPLLFATLTGNVELVRLLYEAGAEINITNDLSDTPLMTAAKENYYSIINFLLEQSINTPEDLELAACSLINVYSSINQMHDVLKLLRLALEHRESMYIPKMCIESIAAYDYKQECQTIDELNDIEDDSNRILIETLLIRERILFSRKDVTIMKPLHDYGDMLVNNGEFDKCLNLWIHMFYLYQQMELRTILHRFVWLFCRMLAANEIIPVDRFLQICYLIFEPSQLEERNLTIVNALFFLIIATKILEQEKITKEEQRSIYRWITDLCRHKLTAIDGKTLIHLCVDYQTNKILTFRPSDTSPHLRFPNLSGLRLLLTCGSRWFDLDAIDSSECNTSLHLICQRTEDQKIIELLLNSGCHIDCVNKNGKTPLDYLRKKETRALFTSNPSPTRLKCLCAHIIAKNQLNTQTLGSSTSFLNKFILLHGGSLFEENCVNLPPSIIV